MYCMKIKKGEYLIVSDSSPRDHHLHFFSCQLYIRDSCSSRASFIGLWPKPMFQNLKAGIFVMLEPEVILLGMGCCYQLTSLIGKLQ